MAQIGRRQPTEDGVENAMKTTTRYWASDKIAVITPGASVLYSQDADEALLLIMSGDHKVPGWKTDGDLWISKSAPVLWIKQDDHELYQPDAAGKCDWCGRQHTGVMSVFTVLTPDEY